VHDEGERRARTPESPSSLGRVVARRQVEQVAQYEPTHSPGADVSAMMACIARA